MSRVKKYIVRLSEDDVALLKKKIKSKKITPTIANRCRILLHLDVQHSPVLTYANCAERLGISQATVSNAVKRYHDEGLESVMTYKRNPNSDQAQRKVDGRMEAAIIRIACGPVPDGFSRWSLKLLEKQLRVEFGDDAVTYETIRRTLKKINFDLTKANTGACRPRQMQRS